MNMNRKKVLHTIVYSIPLLVLVVILFNIYTAQNKSRIIEQNKNYAEDSTRQMAQQISDQFENGLRIITTYGYFFDTYLGGDTVPADTLKGIEASSVFDTVRFTDAEGVTHLSDGRTVNSSDREYYKFGMQGESGITAVFDGRLEEEGKRIMFYAPVQQDGEIIGIIRGSYVAEQYLNKILNTTYFGEFCPTWLCMPSGEVIASSDDQDYGEGSLPDVLASRGFIDSRTADGVRDIFENGGQGVFICGGGSATDIICVTHLPEYDFVLVQTFPPNVTRGMINRANEAGIGLEVALIVLFAVYFILVVVNSVKQRRALEVENRQISYVLKGLNTLFSSKYLTVDLETGIYSYTAGMKLSDNQAMMEGSYADIVENHSREIIGEEAQEDFRQTLKAESIVENLTDQDTFTYECHVMRDGQEAWEQMTVVCIERKEGQAVKMLYLRQDISEMKMREQRRKEEMAMMNRKEMQYRIAITSNAFSSFEFNLTKDLIEQDIVRESLDGGQISLLERAGLQAPCKASECFERWKQYILPESLEDYSSVVNVGYLKECFEKGEVEVDVDYWGKPDGEESRMCMRQTFIMTQDDMSGDVIVMVVSRDITEQVIKQKEQTEALQDALMHARQANEAKTTFLSNMSHDIRTPMNAIIGLPRLRQAVSITENR